jgi:hypothetical protein
MGDMRLGMKKTFTPLALVLAPLGVIAASFTGVLAAPQQAPAAASSPAKTQTAPPQS